MKKGIAGRAGRQLSVPSSVNVFLCLRLFFPAICMCMFLSVSIYVSVIQSFFLMNTIVSVPCPPKFEWDIYTKKCYTSQVIGSANATTALQIYKQLFPGAQFPEPRSSLENERALLRMP